jgi:hypothetical protein
MDHRPSRRLLGPWLLLALSACGGEKGPPGIEGRYVATTENGRQGLVVSRRGEDVVLSFDGEETVGRLVAPGRIEGEHVQGNVTLRYVMERRGDDLAARFTVHQMGQQVEAPEVIFRREAAPAAAGGGAPAGNRPAALVGHWRWTETFAREGISWATDYHLVLEADGTCSSWSRTEGNVSGGNPETRGVWRAEGDGLLVRWEGSSDWQTYARFVADGARLMLTFPNGDRNVYERV